jgi:hypothetical protein
MGIKSPRTPIRLTRSAKLLLAVLIACSWVGTAFVLIGTLSLRSAWARGQLLVAVGILFYTGAGVAATLVRPQAPGARLVGPRWLMAPRLTWLILGIGLALVLVNVISSTLPSPQPP